MKEYQSNRMKMVAFTLGILFISPAALAQNINFDRQSIAFYHYPLKPLDKSVKTYSVSIQELGANLANDQHDSLLRWGLVIPGFEKVKTGGDVQLELIISPLTITNKEIKDQPLESEADDKKSVVHQYWYQIKYAFPAKVKVALDGQTINDQDMPGFFSTEYFPNDRTSQASLQQEFDRDYSFMDKLKYKRIDELDYELRRWLFSTYGYGMASENIEIGYVKDKKGEYADLSKALSLLHNAFASANNNQNYLNEDFKAKAQEAKSIYEKALLESSDDKKARIDQKVTGMIRYNIALADLALNELDTSEEWARKVQKAGSYTDAKAHELIERIQDKRMRLSANGQIEGQPQVVVATKTVQTLEAASSVTRNYLVGKPGDTLDVQFIIPSREVMPFGDSLWLQDQIIVTSEGKKLELKPTQLHGYSYRGVFRESIEWVKDTQTTPWTIENKFCKRLTYGAISVYECYGVVNSVRDPSQQVVVPRMWYRKNSKLNEVMFLNFNKGVSKLVDDYPELTERVKSGYYKREDFVKVMQEYNHWKKGKI